MITDVLLSLLIWIPIIGGMLVLLSQDETGNMARAVAVATVTINLLLCIPLWFMFDPSTASMQFQEHADWLPALGIHYALGVDGISMPMVVLTNFTSLLVVLAATVAIRHHVAHYMAAFLIMQGTMVGVFMATDAILFYIFWEAMLIPMYICIGVWGGPNRSYASIKFFIYTFAGSAFMLVALLYLGQKAGSFNILSFYNLRLTLTEQILIFLAFFAAFAVKVPMWPFHTWLPDAHTEAPSGGSVVLAALMLKMGIYGFIRFNMPITPDASQYLDWFMIVLGLIAIVYVAYIAIVQADMKRLIAYSSVSHMGFAIVGCFMVYAIMQSTLLPSSTQHNDAYLSLEGAMIQMISHAFGSGALFLAVGVLYDQLGSRLINQYRGVASKMPLLAAFTMLFAMSNVGLPGTSGFVGEFMIILSAFRAHFWVAFFAATTLVLGACYTLWFYKRVFFGAMADAGGGHSPLPLNQLEDIGWVYILVFSLLAVGVLWIGVYPQALIHVMHNSIAHTLTLATQSHLTG